jgi:hypothetical protein
MSTGIARIEQRHTFDEMVSISDVAAKSGLFKMTQPQVLTLMMLCESEGLHPIKALQLYDIIDGRPSLKAVALLARFLESGGSVEWHEQSKTVAEATFTHPQTCPKGVKVRYTLEDAQCAGLAHKDNWKKNPADMLVARVCSRGAKRANPACILGMDLPESDEQPAAIETTARASLVDKLAARRERPESDPKRVAETVIEIKAHEARQEPQSEWGQMIADTALEANKAIAELAEQNPGRMELRKALTPQQVINGVIKRYVASDAIQEDALKTNGKRDPQKVADAMAFFWRDDREELEGAVAKYVGDKITEMMGQPEPAVA